MDEKDKNRDLRKRFTFLLNLCPALLVVILVVFAIHNTRPVLGEIPDLLSLNVEAAETKTIESSGEQNSAAGQFEDGIYIGEGTGYGGRITVEVTVKNHSIAAVEILDASDETASFLDKARGVIDKVIQFQTWEVDVVSGATYSSSGILAAIENAITGKKVDSETAPVQETEPLKTDQFEDPDGYKDGVYTGTARGYGGNISVSVTINNGKITDISIISADQETSSYLASAKTVISRIIKAQSPNVDTVSGATYSSNGIINAVKTALRKAAGDSSVQEIPAQEEQPSEERDVQRKPVVEKTDAPEEGYTDGIYTGSARGYGGDITVRVNIKNGRIASVKIVSAKGETSSFLSQAEAVIDRIISTQGTDVDAVSGATYSSVGIMNAVSDALKKADPGKANGKTEQTSGKVDQESKKPVSENQEKESTTGVPAASRDEYKYKDGTYSGIGFGFGGDISVQVVVKNGKITLIKVLEAADETSEYLEQAKKVIDRILKAQNTAVDIVSGATYSSRGIIDAVSDALKDAVPEKESESSKESSKEESPEESSSETESPETESPETESPETESPETESPETESPETESPETESSVEEIPSKYKDGIYTGTAVCSDRSTFNYAVYAQVTIEDGKITDIAVTKPDDTSGANDSYFRYAVKGRKINGVQWTGVVDQIISSQSADNVDAVSRATYSSKAIVEAVQKALDQAVADIEKNESGILGRLVNFIMKGEFRV